MRPTTRAIRFALFCLVPLLAFCAVDGGKPPDDLGTLGRMTTTLTPASPPVAPDNVLGPADGELANAASVNAPLQTLLDGIEFARLAALGRKVQPDYACLDGVNIVVEPLGQIVLTNGAGKWTILEHLTPTTFNAAAKLGSPLVLNTRYYFYVYINGGSADFSVTTDPPDTTLRYRSGGLTSQVYVGTFIYATTAVAVDMIFPFRSYGGKYVYDEIIFLQYQSLAGGGPGVTVPLNIAPTGLSPFPYYAKCVSLGYMITGGAVGAFQSFRRPGSPVWTGLLFNVNGTTFRSGTDSVVDQFDYNDNVSIELANTGVAGSNGSVFAFGFYDRRG